MKRELRSLTSEQLTDETRAMRALARALVHDSNDADDVVQDACVTALARQAKPGWTIRGWLAGITRNRAREQARTDRRRARREQLAAREEAVAADDSLERLDLLRHLLTEVRELAEPYRSTVLMRYFDGVTPSEIARRQNVTHTTVRTRLHRGLELLRARMDETHGGDRKRWTLPLLPFVAVPEPVPVGSIEGSATVAESTIARLFPSKVPVVAWVVGFVGLAVGAGLLLRRDDDRTPGDDGLAELRSETSPSTDRGTSIGAAERVGTFDAATEAIGRRSVMLVGHVRSPDGAPLAGASVEVFEQNEKRSARVIASDGGRYVLRVPAAARGRRKIGVFARGHVGVVERLVLAPGAERLRVDFELRKGIAVRGRVTDASGQPIEGAAVWSASKDGKATTDREGRYTIGSVDPRRVQSWMVARADGYIETKAPTVPAGRAAICDLTLRTGLPVRGHVVTRAGRPVAGANLRLAGSELAVQSDRGGSFELPCAPRGPGSLLVRHADFAAACVAVDVHAASGPLRVTLAPGRVVSGVVRDERGAPIANAKLRVAFDGHKHVLPVLWSDARGEFELRGSPDREIEVACHALGYMPRVASIRPDQVRVRLTLERAVRITGRVVDARSGAPVQRFAVRLFGGLAKKRAGKKGIWRENRFISSDGSWDSGELSFPPGFETSLEIRARGYGPALLHGVVAGADAATCVVELQRQATSDGNKLAGTVRDATGRVVASAAVKLSTVQELDAPRVWRARCDAHGRFEFTRVPDGVYRLAHVQTHAGKPVETYARYVRVVGPMRSVELAPRGAATLVGRIPGDVPASATVWLFLAPRQEASTPWHRRLAPRKLVVRGPTFRVRGVDPASYDIEAAVHDEASQTWMRAQVAGVVVGSGETPVDLRFVGIDGSGKASKSKSKARTK